MNFQRLKENAPAIVVSIIALIFAIYCGSTIGSGQTRTVFIIAAVAIFMAIGLTLKKAVWLIIPFTLPAGGKLLFLPLPLTVREIGIAIAVAWFMIFYAVKILRTRPRYEIIDLFLLAHVVYIAVMYIRYPVGTLAGGSDLIGGRPYFETAIGVAAYLVLARARMTPFQGKLAVFGDLFTSTITSIISAITYFLPQTVPIFARFYSGIEVTTYSQEMDGNAGMGTGGAVVPVEKRRFTFLSSLGSSIWLGLCSFFPPPSILNPTRIFRFAFMIAALVMIGLSGFRNALILSALMFVVASLYHRKIASLWKLALIGIPLFVLFIAGQSRVYHLPFAIQRSLSFLPGNWDSAAVADGRNSIEWRLYMWDAILKEDRYLKNRWFGDGFGYSRAEAIAMQRALDLRQANALQENYIIIGDVHSGPISALRFAGYAGLILHIVLIFYLALYAHRLIRKAYNTPYFPVALFVGLPVVLHPLMFIFVYGHYKTDASNVLIWAGMLKLIHVSLLEYLAEKKQKEEEAEKALSLANPLDWRPPLLSAGFR